MHTGRLRTWNEEEGWGYIWSEVHNCDVFVDGANKGTMLPLCEGDPMIFALNVEEGLPIATFASSAHPHATVEKLLDETEKALRKAEQFAGCTIPATWRSPVSASGSPTACWGLRSSKSSKFPLFEPSAADGLPSEAVPSRWRKEALGRCRGETDRAVE